MQYVVDTYTLEYLEDKDEYYISFKDSIGRECKIEIDKKIYDTYMKSRSAYIKIKNETDRHINISYLNEEDVYNKSTDKGKSVEDIVMSNLETEKLKQAKQNLTATQIRRIELHIVDEVTIRDVAQIEGVRKKQIEKSIQLGIKKFKNFFDD